MRGPLPFVVYTSPRSGSAWLVSLLHSHPAVVCYSELFLAGERGFPSYAGCDLPYFQEHLGGRRRSLLRTARYLRRVYRARPGVEAAGFRLMYAQAAHHPALLPLLALRRARAVHLVRRNLLAAIVSWEVATRTGSFHRRIGDPLEVPCVRLQAASLPGELARRERAVATARRELRRLGLPFVEVAYEDLVAEGEGGLRRLLAFLGVRDLHAPLTSPFQRISTGPPVEAIENAGEVRAALAGTRFARMVEGAGR